MSRLPLWFQVTSPIHVKHTGNVLLVCRNFCSCSNSYSFVLCRLNCTNTKCAHTNTSKRLLKHGVLACRHTNTFQVGYLSFDVCVAVNGGIDSWAHRSFTYFTFLLFLLPQHTFSFTLYKSFWGLDVLVCVCMRVHTLLVNVCVIVCYYRGEGEACLFQGTPPELMFHTCAQCSTLYRASQVHCINCGRNHFIVGVLPLRLFSGVHSITQYSHLNCF